MKNNLFASIIFSLSLAIVLPSNGTTTHTHTDNVTDLNALMSKNTENNLSAATNLHALNIPAINIQFEYMTTKRSLQVMDNSKNICVVNKIKTKERLDKYQFSRPVNLFLGRRLYQLSLNSPLAFNKAVAKDVVLSKLFIKKPTAKVIVSDQISYGDELDAQIANLSEVNKIVRHSSEHDTGLITMFTRGRAEFALLYPHQVYGSDLTIDARSYAITSVPPYVLGHIMCTKNKKTEEFIEKINKHLSTKSSLFELLQIHLNQVNPNDKAVVKHYFQQAFND